ncbi:MAG: Ig-like domain-containing protein, partial [Sedimentisphaerales bacterium]
GSIETSTGRLLLGAGRDVIPPTHLLVGLLDDARIYDGALMQVEIQSIMEGGEGYPYALGPSPADGALHMDIWVTLGWAPGDFAVSHDVYLGDNFDDVDNGAADTFRGNQDLLFYVAGFPGYAYPDGLVPGTTYYWRIDEVNEAEPNSPWKGDIWSFSIPPRTAYNPGPADGTEFVEPDAALSWTAGFGAKLHTVFLGDDFEDINNATGGLSLGVTTYSPGPLDLAKVYYWRIDEFDGVATYKGDVWSFTTPGAVGSLNPANGAVYVKMTTALSWTSADNAASHEVYFGTDKDAVRSATTDSAEYKGGRALGSESYDPGKLASNTTYYWRVDEVDSLGNLSKGPLWSFTTADFISVDDFEDYDAGDNQIWYAWHDGLGYGTPGTEPYFAGNGTGAAVGDETTASYCEESIVHGGGESMPMLYDNNKQGFSMYSEVEFTLSEARDWTDEGVKELSLWFRGVSSNAAEPLYVAVANRTGTPAVVTYDDPAAAQIGAWTKWVIPLQVFADQGINLVDIDRIMVGLGIRGNLTTPGGAGKMYFDDIRLDR